MIVNLIAGILTGFLVSIPPVGPITFAMISKGFKSEVREGRTIAFGAAFMDFFYCLIAFGGITLLISLFPSAVADIYTNNSDLIEIILTFAGCIIVILYGRKIMKSKITYNKLEKEESAKYDSAAAKANKLEEKAKQVSKRLHVKEAAKSNLIGLFFMGVMLCLSSITLPASWIALIGYLKGYNFLDSTFLGGLSFSVGAFAGTFGWFYTLLMLICGHKKRINQATINKLNTFAGIVLLLLGVFLFIKAGLSVVYVI